jgi:uncharacterized membrane protein
MFESRPYIVLFWLYCTITNRSSQCKCCPECLIKIVNLYGVCICLCFAVLVQAWHLQGWMGYEPIGLDGFAHSVQHHLYNYPVWPSHIYLCVYSSFKNDLTLLLLFLQVRFFISLSRISRIQFQVIFITVTKASLQFIFTSDETHTQIFECLILFQGLP